LASNDLDEHIIASLKDQGAAIAVWGVGTKLITAFDQPAMGGVYKLSALRADASSAWQYKLKLSEQSAKISTPGVLQVRRYRSQLATTGAAEAGWKTGAQDGGVEALNLMPNSGEPSSAGVSLPRVEYIADAICNEPDPCPEEMMIVDPLDMTRRKPIAPGTPYEDLLVPIFRGNRLVYDVPSLADVRRRAREQLAMFHPGIKRFAFPHQYPVGLEKSLFDLRTDLILRARGLR
jgi:nicotinate phosphoribosyltransferase